jgi:hypothetical protein
MKRRAFLALTGATGLVPLANFSSAAEPSARRDYFELRKYLFDPDDQTKADNQKSAFDSYMSAAGIPALNRVGVSPVGVFYPEKPDKAGPAGYVLLRHKSLESFATVTQKLAADPEHLQKGAAFWNAPASAPAFKRMESCLMLAFAGMPELELPVKSPGRIFQLRIYESPSVKTGRKKIEMFNDAGEIKIFREVGLNPVFFGETIAGAKMPNLTYMLGFNSPDDMKEGWKKFGGHPEWKKLRGMAEYADKEILCGITNIVLKPADYSQI